MGSGASATIQEGNPGILNVYVPVYRASGGASWDGAISTKMFDNVFTSEGMNEEYSLDDNPQKIGDWKPYKIYYSSNSFADGSTNINGV